MDQIGLDTLTKQAAKHFADGRRNQHQQLDHHIVCITLHRIGSPQLSRSLALCWPSLSAHPGTLGHAGKGCWDL
jgi:hypothetical protein